MTHSNKEEMNLSMKTLKVLKASDFKGQNQTKTGIQHFQNITFETFWSYVSVLFSVFSNFWILLFWFAEI